jgi:hypothetical protein
MQFKKNTKPLKLSKLPAGFTKYFYNSSTIFPSTILPQANPDAPNKEEFWKNCRNILQARAAGKNCGRIVEKL